MVVVPTTATYVWRVWRYQIANQNPQFEEGNVRQWPNEKEQNNDQKTLHRTLSSSNTNATKTRVWTQVLRKGKQFLIH